ncbi:MAG: DUF6361 family protein [Kofleriaceae bacterium]
MEPTLTWLDLTSRDRDKMRRVLDLLTEQNTVDEMGLGTLRDALADALFPGTSSIQTRLRYALFVPWLYQRLERRHVASEDIEREARRAEIALIRALVESDDADGVIGKRAGQSLSRLPSNVYWAGLVHWGIFLQRQTQSWYHAQFSILTAARDAETADDPGVVWERRATWHRQLPRAPEGFPAKASFALTRDEAEFLRGRFEERCAGSLLAWLARNGSASPAPDFWDDPVAQQTPAELRAIIALARRFSLHVEGAPLLYNLLLAEKRAASPHGDRELVSGYRDELAKWASHEAEEAPFDPSTLWAFLALRGLVSPPAQQSFVRAWSERVAAIGARQVPDDGSLRGLVELRERQLKGPRARLVNEGRLLDWSGRVGTGRMDFRWFRVRQLLTDLHRGLES